MNVSGIQKNNVAFGGKNYVAPSLRNITPWIKEYDGFHLCIAKQHRLDQPTPRNIAISVIKETSGKLVSHMSIPFENLSTITKLIENKFSFLTF